MSSSTTFIISFFLLLLISVGCRDANINPYEDKTGIYSVYGAMDLHDSVHVIRVRDLNTFFYSDSSKYLDATVILYDPNKGTSQVLQDSVVQFPVNYTHNFKLKKHFEPRSAYRVEVERSDDEQVSSIFTTPGITEAFVTPNIPGVALSCFKTFKIIFSNVLPTEQIRWFVSFEYNEELYTLEETGYCPEGYDSERNQFVVTINTLGLLNTIFPKPRHQNLCKVDVSPEVTCRDLSSSIVTIRYLHLGPEWKRVFPTRHPDPVKVEDIVNGLGFLGAYREDSFTYPVRLDE